MVTKKKKTAREQADMFPMSKEDRSSKWKTLTKNYDDAKNWNTDASNKLGAAKSDAKAAHEALETSRHELAEFAANEAPHG